MSQIPSKFCLAAIRAVHRAEQDSFADIAVAINVIAEHKEWGWASNKAGKNNRDSGNIYGKLWTWCNKRWGKDFPHWEYTIREEELRIN